MKKWIVFLLVGLFGIASVSGDGMTDALTPQGVYKPLTATERTDTKILGQVTTRMHTAAPNLIALPPIPTFEDAAEKLLVEASMKYPGAIDVRNVVVKATKYYAWTHEADFMVEGTVIVMKTATSAIESAVSKAAEQLISGLKENTTIAVISISSRDRDMSEFVVEEIEYILVDARLYKIVDRKTLDKVRAEQNFQMSGDVDDNSAVSIGKMLGANIVITGSISGSDSTRRLRLKALDVKTAQILAMASERF